MRTYTSVMGGNFFSLIIIVILHLTAVNQNFAQSGLEYEMQALLLDYTTVL
jgi:hypothetical protein